MADSPTKTRMPPPPRAASKKLREYMRRDRGTKLVGRGSYSGTVARAVRHGIRTPNGVLIHSPRDWIEYTYPHPRHASTDGRSVVVTKYGANGPYQETLYPIAAAVMTNTRIYVIWADEPIEEIIEALKWLKETFDYIIERYVIHTSKEEICSAQSSE